MKVAPTKITDATGASITSHPAFGMVSVNRISSSGSTLHASDLSHHEVIELQFFEGDTQDHDGTVRHRRKSRRPLLEVQLSPAQWATMITSFGLGDGVPCTLSIKTTGEMERLPSIQSIETTRQRFDRQIAEAAERQLSHLRECHHELAILVAKGKAGKRELEELYRRLGSQIGNLPKNLAFSTTLMQEAMDDIVSSGKAELEAVALGVATRLGIKEIRRLVELEDKSGKEAL